ncbi:microtubule binding motor protein [Lithospermum erythrorhizon]|uniref:Kinesin-like protein n=1 Tax=Lithospermum erythrorhizon TaxID=34254 RepID=A0AAV3NP53_LITER
MNFAGRQMKKSGSNGEVNRQFSDNFIETTFNNKWLQSAGLHHLHSSNTSVPPLQEFGFYGNNVGVSSSRIGGNLQRGGSVEGNEEPWTPPASSRSSSMRKAGNVEGLSPSELSPGLLDLHSFDTELIAEVSSQRSGSSQSLLFQGMSPGDSDPYSSSNRSTNNARGLHEKDLLNSFPSDKERATNVARIKVVVRKRPLNKKELAKKEEDIISIDPPMNSLSVYETKLKVDLTEYVERHEFTFDAVMDENVSNDEIYSQTVEPIVPIIFQRTKATCFAYGQTGSGKTYTMQPLPLRASQDIFSLMQRTYRNQGFQLFVSFFEIYGGKVFDLLNDRNKLFMREDGKQQVCIVGLQEYRVYNVETIKDLIEKGNATRSTGTTGANEESSRSHAILQLAIKRSVDGSDLKPHRMVGKLSFIDLAGSERGADTTDNDKQTRMEGAEINKSLLALKECIRALDNDQGHIPFRGSKLTEVLRDSFVGDSRTVMISCISPNSGSCEHTLNTLRYADRVKSLSKGNNSRREPSSISNLRNSVAVPLSSVFPAAPGSEDVVIQEANKFGWSKPNQRESPASSSIDRVPSGRMQTNLDINDLDYFEEDYGRFKSPWMPDKISDRSQTSNLENNVRQTLRQAKRRDPSHMEADSDLVTLLKEEEDLVNAHRKQVEETMDMVKEEMNMLADIDQPGNQIDDYMSKLHTILAQKASGILDLQSRLTQFQEHLKDTNVLVSSSDH